MSREQALSAQIAVIVMPLAALFALDDLRALIAVPALLLVPGYSWVRALQRQTAWAPDRAEGLAFGVALSFVGLAVGGVLLSALSIPLRTTSWALLVIALTAPALALMIAPCRRTTAFPAARGARLAPRRAAPPALNTALIASLAAAAAISAAEVLTLRSAAVNRAPMTELALQPTNGSHGERLLAVLVRNDENRDLAYTLELRTADRLVASFDQRLSPGTSWVETVDLDDVRHRGEALRALLFRSDKPGVPYRSARLAPDPSLAPPCSATDTQSSEVVCSRSSAVWTVVREGQPLVLPGVEARVLRSTYDDGVLAVRLRLHNSSTRSRRFIGSGLVYLSVGGRRLRGVTTAPGSTLAPGETATLQVRFGPDPAIRVALSRGERVDLGVRPLVPSARRQLGVVRLTPTRR